MKRFKNILVFANGREDIDDLLGGARQLAQRNEATLTVCDVVPALPSLMRLRRVARTEVDLEDLVIGARFDQLSRQIRDNEQLEVFSGNPFVEVIGAVQSDGYDLVMMAPEEAPQRSGLTGATTTLHLLRKSPVPVLVDQPASEERPDVAVAVGPLDPEEEPGALNTTLVELGSSLAERRGGVLHIIHAWRLYGESFLTGSRAGLSRADVDALALEAETAATHALKRLIDVAMPADSPFEVHLQKGEPADVICRAVDQRRPGVLVMGTLARSGVRGLIIGNTAEQVLGTVDTSILAVKPPGFVSPVGPG